MDLGEFKISLVYSSSSRTAKAAQRNPVLKNWKRKRRLKVGRGWGGGVDLEGIRGHSKG